MAYFKRVQEESKNTTLENIIDIANRADGVRTRETTGIVRAILKEEKGRNTGLRMTGNMQYIPKGGNAVVIGDLHGDESSLVKILKETDFVERVKKGEKLKLIFLGDYIDRGPNQVEVVNIVFELKRSFPDNVVMLRGDHEAQPSSPNSPGGRDFLNETIRKYKDFEGSMFRHYFEAFGMLPLAAKSENGILFVHGGISDKTDEASIAYGGDEIERDILWNDPRNISGMRENDERGIGSYFGRDVLRDRVLIRGHEPVRAENVEMFGGKLLTINSSYIPGYLAHKDFAVGYGYVSLEKEVDDVRELFHRI